MKETVAVVIASFGDKEFWDRMAERAIGSVSSQSREPDEFLRIHGDSLHQTRNSGAEQAKSKYLLFLDCDDEFEPGYIEAMMCEAVYPNELRYPRVRYISENKINPQYQPDPIILPKKPLERGNYMAIGTLVQREMFLAVGGFRDLRAYEDWDLWIRCWMYGAEPRLIRDAVYRATKRNGGRNTVSNPRGLCAEILEYNRRWQRENFH